MAADTLTTLFSASKPLRTICPGPLRPGPARPRRSGDGVLARSSAPVGKQHTLARHILAHSSGWSAWPEALLKSDGTGFDDYDAIAAQLAAAEPAWEPGTKSVYLALTFGWLVNELIRRISGTALGAVFRDEVAPPWNLDRRIGAPEDIHPRAGDLHPPAMSSMTEDDIALGTAPRRASDGPGIDPLPHWHLDGPHLLKKR